MDSIIRNIEKEQTRIDLPKFLPGDTIVVYVKIMEGNKERLQSFKGVVISKKNGTSTRSFTVRKISHGIGVEKVFSLKSPFIEKIGIITRGRVKRAKIYYLRKLRGKASRIREKR